MAVTGIIKPTVAGSSASPNLGNGGADYNTAEAALKKKIAQNQINIATNKNHVESETSRALKVIQERQAAGQDTSAQQKYLNTNLGYKAPTANANANTSGSPTTSFSGNGVGSASQIKSNTDQSRSLMDQMNAIATRQATEFSYDPNTDPSYQAALKRARANINDGNSQAQAEMNRRGILNSTITSDRMGEIASAEMGNVETTIVPQLMAQAYQKHMDAQNQEQQRFGNMGTLSGMYTNEDQRAIDNNFTEANMTGNYVPEAAKPIISQILQLKQQAETQGISAADKAKLSAMADGQRAKLLALGVDPSAYSATVNYDNASLNPGIRTIAGQQLDQSKKAQTFDENMATRQQNFTEGQQNWQNNFATEQQAYQAARDAISDSRWQSEFDQGVEQFGLNYALNKLQETNQTAYQQAQLGLSKNDQANGIASNNFAQMMDVWKATGTAPEGINGVAPGTRYGGAESVKAQTAEGYATSYLDKAAQYDPDTGMITNVDPIEDMILESGLPFEEKKKLFLRYGIPLPSGE